MNGKPFQYVSLAVLLAIVGAAWKLSAQIGHIEGSVKVLETKFESIVEAVERFTPDHDRLMKLEQSFRDLERRLTRLEQ